MGRAGGHASERALEQARLPVAFLPTGLPSDLREASTKEISFLLLGLPDSHLPELEVPGLPSCSPSPAHHLSHLLQRGTLSSAWLPPPGWSEKGSAARGLRTEQRLKRCRTLLGLGCLLTHSLESRKGGIQIPAGH